LYGKARRRRIQKIYAFASELLEGVKIDPLKEKLTGFLSDWLPEGRIVGEASER
jgi:hypothetical protein